MLKKKHSDFNGHVSEAGFLTIANEAIWQVFDAVGLSDIFLVEKIGPIIFDTFMQFKIEVMEGDTVIVHFKAKLSDDSRKIFREIDITNQEGQVAVRLKSNGAFLDLEKRKVTSASNAVREKFNRYLSN